MKNRPERNTNQQKKPYAKPEVKQVQLRPEEAVLGFCKTTTSSTGYGGFCGLTCPSLGS